MSDIRDEFRIKVEEKTGVYILERKIKHTRKGVMGFNVEVFDFPDHSNSYCYMYKSPTSNCQLFTTASVENILDVDNGIQTQDLLKLFDKMFKAVAKPLMLVDVRDRYVDRLEEAFKSEEHRIIVKSPYNSTSGNKMTLYLINVQNLIPDDKG